MARASPAPRIALLSPYWGGNLGDAAIIQASIENLRSKDPRVEFVGITMRPEGMRRQHRVDGTTLVSFALPYYSAPASERSAAILSRDRARLSLPRRVKLLAAERFPLLYERARQLRELLSALPSEVRHYRHAVQLMRQTSVLVVAGGGQFDDEWGGAWSHPYALYKWAKAAKAAGCPTVFLGVGVARLNSRTSRWFASQALRLASSVSLRDPWSKSFVEKTLHFKRASLVPDLAFSLPIDPVPARNSPSHTLTIGVSPIAYGRREVWPTVAHEVAERYLHVLAAFVVQLIKSGHQVVLFHTDTPDSDVVQRLAQATRASLQATESSRLRIANTASLNDLLATLPTLDLVVASRLHGVILSHLHAIPALAISYDRKVSTHMSQVENGSYCLELPQLSLEDLTGTFANLRVNRGALHLQLVRFVNRSREELRLQFENVLAQARVAEAANAGVRSEKGTGIHVE